MSEPENRASPLNLAVMHRQIFLSTLFALAFAMLPARAQVGIGPRPATPTVPIEAPRDRLFRGTIQLDVDATDTTHHIYLVHERIPVQETREMVLLYPR